MSENGTVLENDIVKLVLDKETASINSLINKSVDKDMISFKTNTHLFRIVYAIENYRGHHFDSEDQKIDKIDISRHGNKYIAAISYNSLCSSNGAFDLRVKVIIELEDGSDEFHMWIEIANNDKGQVTQIWFPWIKGLTTIGDGDDDLLAYPSAGGSLIPNPMDYFPHKGEDLEYHMWTRGRARTILAKPYPGRCSMQWMDIGCKDYGVYLACLNKEGDFLVPRVQKHLWEDEENLSLAMVKYPYINKGDTWTSPIYALSFHKGDWHIGADKYRNWLDCWLVKREKAGWAKNTNGFYHFILTHQDGTIINSIEDIPEILSEAKDHGINLLFVCGWFKGGHDGNFPDYEPNQPDKLKKALTEVHNSGGYALFYLNAHGYDISRPDYQKEGYDWTVKTYNGLPMTELVGWAIPHYPSYESVCLAFMCPSAIGWQNKYIEKIKRAVKIGADCTLFDQLLSVNICHDSNHGHKSPESSYGPGAVEMLRKAFEEGRKLNPEFELSMEGLVDIYTPYVGIFHSRVDLNDEVLALTDRVNPEVFRYTLPWVTGITGGFIDMGLKDKLYHSFLNGLPLDIEMHTHSYGRLSFDPELAREIKRVNMLREEHKDLFVDGVFMDNIGLEVNKKDMLSKLFRAKNSILLTLWNKSSKASDAQLIIDLLKLGFEAAIHTAFVEDGIVKEKRTILQVKSDKGKIFINVPNIASGDIAIVRAGGIK